MTGAFFDRFRWSRGLLTAAAGVAAVYGFLLLDTSARAREACREADRYALWSRDPAVRRRDVDERFGRDQARLSRDREAGRLTEEAYALEMDLLRVRHETSLSQSASGLAHQWYRDAHRLFSPPETPWSRRARLLAPAYKELWRQEVKRRGLPVRDAFWNDEPGLAAGERVVLSARRQRAAERAAQALAARGIPARAARDPRPRGAGDGWWIVVPEARFWEAHEVLKAALGFPVPTIVVQSPAK